MNGRSGMKPSLRSSRASGSVAEVDAGDLHVPARRPQNAGDHAQRRRLSGAVGPEKAEQLAVGHAQIDANPRR